jgi:hypothetical protein
MIRGNFAQVAKAVSEPGTVGPRSFPLGNEALDFFKGNGTPVQEALQNPLWQMMKNF